MEPESGTAKDDLIGLLNVFVDPASTAKQLHHKWFWVWPVLITSIVFLIVGFLLLPITLHVMEVDPATASRMGQIRDTVEKTQKIAVGFTPVFIVVKLLLLAGILMVTCTVMNIRANFRVLFNLVAACSLISMLQYIAAYIVLRAKTDDLTALHQLSPPFGLDIFLSENTSKVLLTIANFFSIFEIYYLIMLALCLAYLTGISKGKAFVAITPIWIFSLLFSVVASFIRR